MRIQNQNFGRPRAAAVRRLALGAALAATLAGCGAASQTQSATMHVTAKVIGHVGDRIHGAPLVRVNGQTGVSFLVPATIAQASGGTGTLVSVPSAAVLAGSAAPSVDETPLAESVTTVHTYLTLSGTSTFHIVAARFAQYWNVPRTHLRITAATPVRVLVVYRTICGRHAPVTEDSVNYMGASSAVAGQTPLTQQLSWPLVSVSDPLCWVAAAVATARETPVKLQIVTG